MAAHTNGEVDDLEAKYNWPDVPNVAAPGVDYYTPQQAPPAGTAKDPEHAAALFKPLKIRGLQLPNRIFVSLTSRPNDEYGFVTFSVALSSLSVFM